MVRTLINETVNKSGQTIQVQGWINSLRKHGKLIFFDLRDRTGLLQCVISQKENPPVFDVVFNLKPESVIKITGKINKRPENAVNPNILTGTVEMAVNKVEVLAEAEALPFDLGTENLDLNLDTLFDYRTLSLRHPKIKAVFKVQETIVQSFRNTLKNLDFTEIQAPTLVPNAPEGGANLFEVKYYDHIAYLGQSPQLYKQIMVSIFERVFTVAHAYRAEPSVTTRHLSEYIGLDAELGFIESFTDLFEIVSTVIKNIILDVKEKNVQELQLFQTTLPAIPDNIPIIKLKDAQKEILARTGIDHTQEPDLDPEDEREICRFAKDKFGSDLIFITHYPTSKRPFYTYPDPENPEFTQSFDLIGLGLEWITGGRRINDYQTLINHIHRWGNKEEDFELYLQAFRYGMPPEGGFCLGLERITAYILGLRNIREASLFPRDMSRVDIKL